MKAGTGSVGGVTSDIAGLHLGDQAEDEAEKEKFKEQPGLSMKQEELLAKVRKDEEESDKKNISLIVVGTLLALIVMHADDQVMSMLGNRR